MGRNSTVVYEQHTNTWSCLLQGCRPGTRWNNRTPRYISVIQNERALFAGRGENTTYHSILQQRHHNGALGSRRRHGHTSYKQRESNTGSSSLPQCETTGNVWSNHMVRHLPAPSSRQTCRWGQTSWAHLHAEMAEPWSTPAVCGHQQSFEHMPNNWMLAK